MKSKTFSYILFAISLGFVLSSCDHDTAFDPALVQANAVAKIYIEQDAKEIASYEIKGNTMLSSCDYQAASYPKAGSTEGWVVGQSKSEDALYVRYYGDSCGVLDPAKGQAEIRLYLRDGTPLRMKSGQVSLIRHQYEAYDSELVTLGRFYGDFEAEGSGDLYQVTGKWMIETYQ